MLARHQTTSSRCADRRSGKRLREANPLARHLIDVGCANVRVPQARELVIAEFIGHDEHDVRTLLGERRRAPHGERYEQQ